MTRALAAAGVLILSGASLGAAAPVERAAAAASEMPRERVWRDRFPNIVLRTHEGKTVRFYDDLIRGKIVAINFMYVACTGFCPGATANLLKVQQRLGDRMGRNVWFYSISLRPEEDSPEVLAGYAERYKVGPGWLFLTGDPDDIELLRRNLGFSYPTDPRRDSDKSAHSRLVLLGNEPYDWWGTCPAASMDANQVTQLIQWMSPGASGLRP